MLGSLGREHQQCRRFLTSPGWVWPVWLCFSALLAGHPPGLIISIQRWSRRCSSGSPSPTSSTGTSSSLSISTLTTSSTSFTGISSSASTRWGTGWSSQLMELFQRFVWSRKLNIFCELMTTTTSSPDHVSSDSQACQETHQHGCQGSEHS